MTRFSNSKLNLSTLKNQKCSTIDYDVILYLTQNKTKLKVLVSIKRFKSTEDILFKLKLNHLNQKCHVGKT